ncbi:MAG: livH [Ilumatobacteraceae bacterium]|nr:livH [Ilumatobacteraceae bacterium]
MDFFLQQTINGIAIGSVYVLFALGFSLVIASLRVFHVAHAAVFTWGAIFNWHLVEGRGWPLAVSLAVAALLTGALNVLCYLALIRHLEDRPNKEFAAFISSLGGMIVLTELASRDLDRSTVGLPARAVPRQVWDIGGVRISIVQLMMLVVAALAFALLHWLIQTTRFGRQIQAVAYDRETARMLGVNVLGVNALVFFLSGALAGVSAVLVSVSFNVVSGSLGDSYLVIVIAVMVVGGFGHVAGNFAGGFIVGLVSVYTSAYITSAYREVVIYSLLLLFLVVRPTGLFRTSPLQVKA